MSHEMLIIKRASNVKYCVIMVLLLGTFMAIWLSGYVAMLLCGCVAMCMRLPVVWVCGGSVAKIRGRPKLLMLRGKGIIFR